ncbi:alpha/beta fold hydrolase [Nonomuraea sp. NPDC050790]|uniref:alpha/beta fold hydrolase n=1 Tax=Nonomuraea sp. NPDC050790 TaxID=3364371 RepID=UPI00378C1597
MRHADWGTVSARWAGIRSETADVHGVAVHYLRAGSERDGPAHLLVHPLGGSATLWMDLIPHLAAFGPVYVPDLPGTLFGHTEMPHPRAARLAPNVRFLRAFAATLGLEKATVHGWSMGGLVAALFADLAPERVGRLVLAAPALPARLPEEEARWWRTIGRACLSAGQPLARTVLRAGARPLLEMKIRAYTLTGAERLVGGDLSRLSPEMTELITRELRGADPARLGDAVTAVTSMLRTVFADPEPARAALSRVSAPTLVMWGETDHIVIDGAREDLTARRPDWTQHTIPEAGHVFPLETPGAYAETLARWAGYGS